MRQVVVTQTGTGTSVPIPADIHGRPEVSIQAVTTGTVNFTVEQTLDDIMNPAVTPTWFPCPVSAFVGATANQQAGLPFMPSALRLVVNSGSGSVRFTMLQAGAYRG
jgi:hypothetical protein